MDMPRKIWYKPTINPDLVIKATAISTNITSITISGDEVIIEFANTPTVADVNKITAFLKQYGYTDVKEEVVTPIG